MRDADLLEATIGQPPWNAIAGSISSGKRAPGPASSMRCC
jgi:hypothetical protein